jgi:AraC family transcriptional regulator, regulatory protein of adaptative response / methylated-DNA-[protein]-cysteine methyltransferase
MQTMQRSDTMLRYLVRPCWLGSVLVAGTDHGVAAILLGDTAASLVRDLRLRFPTAGLVRGDAVFGDLADAVVGAVTDPAARFERPFDLQGTDVERRVWAALREIPAGTTVAYSEIAGRLGAPVDSRDVAQACASNPLAVVVPCHRVVRKGGGLGGYRWGVARKRALLAREAAWASAS